MEMILLGVGGNRKVDVCSMLCGGTGVGGSVVVEGVSNDEVKVVRSGFLDLW